MVQKILNSVKLYRILDPLFSPIRCSRATASATKRRSRRFDSYKHKIGNQLVSRFNADFKQAFNHYLKTLGELNPPKAIIFISYFLARREGLQGRSLDPANN